MLMPSNPRVLQQMGRRRKAELLPMPLMVKWRRAADREAMEKPLQKQEKRRMERLTARLLELPEEPQTARCRRAAVVWAAAWPETKTRVNRSISPAAP
jgi:hypothetical protein